MVVVIVVVVAVSIVSWSEFLTRAIAVAGGDVETDDKLSKSFVFILSYNRLPVLILKLIEILSETKVSYNK